MDQHPMKKIRIEKLTLNIGAGKNIDRLDSGVKLIKEITGKSPVKTFTNKRIPTWGLRPGLPIGCKLTIRRSKASDLLVRLLQAKDNKLKESQFDELGNIAFGIHEYIDIPGVRYDPEIGILGLQVCITLERLGYRIKRRKLRRANLSKTHKLTKQDAINFMENQFKVGVVKDDN